MIYAVFIATILIAPYAVLKAYEIYKVKKNKTWSDEPAEHIDLWDYPSNMYRGGKK